MDKQPLIKRIKSNFSLKLAVGIAVFSLLGLAATYIIVNTVVRDTIYGNVVNNARLEQSIHAGEIDAWFGTAIQTINNLANVLRAMPSDSYFAPIIEHFTEEYDFVDNIFIGFPDGSSINGLRWVPPLGWYLSDRPWYINALAAEGEVAVLDAFWSHSGQAVVAALSIQIPDAGEAGLVLGLSITLDHILDRVSRYSVIGDGYLILLGEDGRVVTHPEPYYSLGPDMDIFNLRDDIEGGSYIMDKIAAGVHLARINDVRVGPSYFVATPLENVNWTLISIIPITATEAIITNSLAVIMVSFSLFLIILLAVIMFFVSMLERSESKSQADLREVKAAAQQERVFMKREQQLYDANPIPASLWGRDNKMLNCNEALVELFGLSSKQEVIDRFEETLPLHQLSGTPTKKILGETQQEAFKNGTVHLKWLHIKPGTGELIPCEVTVVRIDDDAGKGYMLATYLHDLRESEAAAEREREVNELNEMFIKNSPLIMNIWKDAKNLIYTSQQAIKMFELDNMEQYIERFFDLSPEYQPCGTPSREKAFNNNKQAFAEGSLRFDWMHQKLNGELIPTEIIMERFTRQGKPFVAAFTIDLRAAKAIHDKEANERIQLMANATPLIIEYWDADGKILDCNQTAMDYYGYTTKEEYFERIKKDFYSWGNWHKTLAEVFENGFAHITIEDPQPDGSIIYFKIEAVRVKHNNKFVAVTYAQDVTHLRKLEKEERRARIAEESNRAKTMFIANMSHEIRTPMNSILGYSELALDDTIPNTTREHLKKIITNARLLLNIINDVLDLSKIESGNLELEKIPFSIKEIMEHCRSLLMPTAAAKGITLDFKMDTVEQKYLLGDPTKLIQICVNLLSNAIKFTDKGLVLCSVFQSASTDEDCSLRFEFKDTGIGMSEEQLAQIFEPFVQADSSTTRKHGGTGLGLAITKRLLEAMGGQLTVETALGHGCKFTFELTFPAAKIDTDKNIYLGETAVTAKPHFDKGEILVVDDNDMNLGVACEYLSRVGLTTYIAKNGKEAVEIVKKRMEEGKELFDLIFMDMHMPEMDGRKAASIISGYNLGIPIIAMTAETMVLKDDAPYKAYGIQGCLSKPFTAQELWQCLLQYLLP